MMPFARKSALDAYMLYFSKQCAAKNNYCLTVTGSEKEEGGLIIDITEHIDIRTYPPCPSTYIIHHHHPTQKCGGKAQKGKLNKGKGAKGVAGMAATPGGEGKKYLRSKRPTVATAWRACQCSELQEHH